MKRAITRLFDSHSDAIRAVEDLQAAGVDHDRISVVSNDAESWRRDGRLRDDRDGIGRDGDGDNDTAEGAGKGAATGGLIGGAGGLLAGLGMLAIPGLGPVVAAGWLASTAVGAIAGAAAGGAAGGLLGALKDAGHSDEEAHVYSEGVRRGGTLVSVQADGAEADRVEQILNGRGVDAMTRGADYRSAGWNRFEHDAQPYTAEEIAAERRRYTESRSFAADEGYVSDEGTPRDRTSDSPGISAPIRGTDV